MGSFVRVLLCFVVAVATTFVLAVTAYTQLVIADLEAAGIVAPMGVRLRGTLANLAGFFNPAEGRLNYPVLIVVGLLVAFAIAFAVQRAARSLAWIAYPLAGAAAIAVALYAIEANAAELYPAMAGARDWLGVAAQCLAGAIGGLVFFAGTRQMR